MRDDIGLVSMRGKGFIIKCHFWVWFRLGSNKWCQFGVPFTNILWVNILKRVIDRDEIEHLGDAD